MKDKKILHLIIGPALFALCCLFIPSSVFGTLAARAAVGSVAWLAYWWVTRPVDLAVTAFLPIAVNAFIEMAPMKDVVANYSSETIMLLLGSSILAVSMERTGLEKRIAAKFLGIIGENLRLQLIFWFLLSTILSAVLPNAVVCATITPIAVSMLKFAGEGDIKNSKIGSKLLLYIAYGVGVGGLCSPLGGAMNLVTVDYLQQETGTEFMYYVWVIRFLPIMLVLLVSNIIFMLRDVKKGDALPGSKQYFKDEYKKLPKMSKEEIWSLVLFLTATVLSFARSLYEDYVPGLKPAYVFIICAVLSFLITNKNRERVMIWKEVQGRIVWELIFVFAGGLAAGTLINSSGAAGAIGSLVADLGLKGGILMVFVIVTVTLILSDVTSNTATASVALPIVISVVKGIDPTMNVVPWIYVATIGVNLSYCLPTSIRAIPVGYGLEPKYMLKEGWKMSIMVI
ncbi:MAG: anion permease, partial [Clostridia bacterium]|nr:anion permease [Clostridia bacterium]